MMKIEDWLKDYCEEREFRLTIRNNRFHLLWWVNDNVRTSYFDDAIEVKHFVENRNV